MSRQSEVNGEAAEDTHRPMTVLWIAFATAVVIYFALAKFLGPSIGDTSRWQDSGDRLYPLFAVFMILQAGLIIGLRSFLARRLEYRIYCLARWTMAEMIALLGLALAFLGKATTHTAAFFALSLILLVLTRPGREAWGEYRRLRGTKA